MASATRNAVRRVEDGPGRILQLIATGEARTRSALSDATGLSRSTVLQRLDTLTDLGLIHETEELVSSGGRPSRAISLNASAGRFAAIDFGEERTRIAVTDLNARVLVDHVQRFRLEDGPEELLDRASGIVQELLLEPENEGGPLTAIGLGLPAPVDYDAGKILGWSIMSGWDGFDIRNHLRQQWNVPVVIDNDVNLLTLAELRRHWPTHDHLLYLKAGTGIGSGLIVNGQLHRGAQGAAGDIGHARITGYGDPQCRCGNLGCLEALAGGWALARDLRTSHGNGVREARDVAALVQRGDAEAVAKLRAAGRILGEAVAFATSLFNPSAIVLGGILSATGDHLIAGVREVIYQRALPLATRQLRIVPTRFSSRAGIAGAAYLARDHVFEPKALDLAISDGTFVPIS